MSLTVLLILWLTLYGVGNDTEKIITALMPDSCCITCRNIAMNRGSLSWRECNRRDIVNFSSSCFFPASPSFLLRHSASSCGTVAPASFDWLLSDSCSSVSISSISADTSSLRRRNCKAAMSKQAAQMLMLTTHATKKELVTVTVFKFQLKAIST